MALPREPQRRPAAQRKRHLDASVVPVERALLARAEAMEDSNQLLGRGDTAYAISLILAAEFRALAEELHFW